MHHSGAKGMANLYAKSKSILKNQRMRLVGRVNQEGKPKSSSPTEKKLDL